MGPIIRRQKKKAARPSLPGRLLALLPLSCVLFYPVYLSGQLDLKEETYYSPRLPSEFEGLRIVYLSDIHYGTFFREDRLRALVERVNALQPDLILLGGDYAEDSQTAVEFWQLHPGFKAGLCVAGVMGNHDRTLPESNLLWLTDAMEADGVCPLVNDALLLEKAGKTLALCGIDDFYNGHPDMEKAARKCENADFTIFLPHTPDALADLEKPFYQLALCGHTHGGQVTLFGRALLSSSSYGSRYLSGWYHEKGADFLVSNGVGVSALPVRLGARAQFHLITLTALQKEQNSL